MIYKTYKPETAADFFDELEAALRQRPDYRKVYNALNQTFQKCLNQNTEDTQVIFGGAFAKTDYLLKERGASRRLTRDTNDTRARLRKRYELTDDELQKYCLHDLKSLCQFFACVFQTDIPAKLVSLFPTEKPPSFTPDLVVECMRVILEQWDEEYLYVEKDTPGSEDRAKVCYAHGNRVYDYDWTYLRDLLHKGAQLNLVRPREDGGIIYPELII